MAEPSALPILARLEEAEAIAANSNETITNEIENAVGSDAGPAAALGIVDCGDIGLGESVADRATGLILKRICVVMVGLLDGVDDTIRDLLSGASAALNGVIGEIEALASGLTDTIVATLNSVVDTITETLDASVRSILNTAESVVSSISDFIEQLLDRLDRGISDVLTSLGFAISALIASVSDSFSRVVDAIGSLVDRIESTVKNVADFLVTLAESTLEAMSTTVAAVLGPLVGAGESVLARLGDLVESVPGALKDAAGAVAEGVGKFVGEPLNALGSIFVTQIEDFFRNLIEEGNLSHGEIIRTLFSQLGAPGEVIDKIANAADDATPSTPGFTAMALSFLIPLILAQFIGSALEPLAIQLQQEVGGSIKQTLISPADLLDGLFKGDIPESRVSEDFKQAGFTEERVTQLIATFRQAPDVSVQIQAWLRNLIEESELDDALAANRMRGNDIELLKKVVFFVPPAQDLIRMAVREVFSPEIRERFGQDEDFPEEFATFARQQGISDDWARAYWAAHWALPSPAQGFEMLHRKVIEPEDLDVLLRALDVMPFWRDKLTQIAFSPLTRVDLRRMHALGLLTDKELQTRYEAIGFSADDAALMVSFTVVFNTSEDELSEELVGLTRASVLNMFEDGLVSRDDAVALITQMGLGEDAAELYVEQRDLEVSRRERNSLIESVIGLAGGGRISLAQAEDSLGQLGISAIEITRAVGQILGLIDDRDRLPSLAALEKMHKKEIIDGEVFLESIKALGFNDEWAAREFTLLTGSEPA